tara:strand:+ start:2948 stop:3463 length:516 start_codon:yes stop_codon:yes gene_type:complete
VKHDSIDFTGIIALVENWKKIPFKFDRIFYMHDSMVVRNITKFENKLNLYNLSRTCSLQMGQSMNIGMYAVRDFLNDNFIFKLKGKINSTYQERLQLKLKGARGLEGILFDRYRAWAHHEICGCDLTLPHKDKILTSVVTISNETLRKIYYVSWGIVKYQHMTPTHIPLRI